MTQTKFGLLLAAAVVVVLGVLSYGTAANAQQRLFLYIDGIEGESTDRAHAKEIDVDNFEFGVVRAGGSRSTGGATSGRADFHDIVISKKFDKSSVELMKAAATGKHLPEAKLTLQHSVGGAHRDYLVITLKDVLVSRWAPSGSVVQAGATEEVGLNYGQIEVRYRYMDARTGELKEAPMFGWNVETDSPK
jgi:type VI secretion system secreted protein Hcp